MSLTDMTDQTEEPNHLPVMTRPEQIFTQLHVYKHLLEESGMKQLETGSPLWKLLKRVADGLGVLASGQLDAMASGPSLPTAQLQARSRRSRDQVTDDERDELEDHRGMNGPVKKKARREVRFSRDDD
jgi:hypothetical protein